jgi:hypothetical protein
LDYFGVTEGDLDFSIYLSNEANTDLSPASIIVIGAPGTIPGANENYAAIGEPDLNCLTLARNPKSFRKMLSKVTCEGFPEDSIQQIDLCLHVTNSKETKVIGKIWNFNTASWEFIINRVIPTTQLNSRIVKGSIYVDDPSNYINNGVMYTYVYNVDPDDDPSGSPPSPEAIMCIDYYKLCVKCPRDTLCYEEATNDPIAEDTGDSSVLVTDQIVFTRSGNTYSGHGTFNVPFPVVANSVNSFVLKIPIPEESTNLPDPDVGIIRVSGMIHGWFQGFDDLFINGALIDYTKNNNDNTYEFCFKGMYFSNQDSTGSLTMSGAYSFTLCVEN